MRFQPGQRGKHSGGTQRCHQPRGGGCASRLFGHGPLAGLPPRRAEGWPGYRRRERLCSWRCCWHYRTRALEKAPGTPRPRRLRPLFGIHDRGLARSVVDPQLRRRSRRLPPRSCGRAPGQPRAVAAQRGVRVRPRPFEDLQHARVPSSQRRDDGQLGHRGCRGRRSKSSPFSNLHYRLDADRLWVARSASRRHRRSCVGPGPLAVHGGCVFGWRRGLPSARRRASPRGGYSSRRRHSLREGETAATYVTNRRERPTSRRCACTAGYRVPAS